jgi:ATP-dependent Lon protease
VRGVGAIVEKIFAARQAGMRRVLIPKENAREVDATLAGLEVVTVTSVAQVLRDLPTWR